MIIERLLKSESEIYKKAHEIPHRTFFEFIGPNGERRLALRVLNEFYFFGEGNWSTADMLKDNLTIYKSYLEIPSGAIKINYTV